MVTAMALMIKENCIKGTKQAALNRLTAGFIFIALFMVSAMRLAIGNDYWVYKLNFDEIAEGNVGILAYEFGFNGIVALMQFIFGKNCYLLIFALFAFITVFFFVKAIGKQSEWYAFSLFLLLANGFYFSSLNSVRYYVAFAIALYSMRYVIEKQHLKFILTIIAASLIHKTVLIVIPIYYLCRIRWRKEFLALLSAFGLSLVLFKNFYRKIIFLFYPFYRGSAFDNNRVSYVNIAKAAAIVVLCIIFYKQCIKDDIKNTFYFNLNVLALIVYACCSFVPEYTRLGYYMSASHIFLVPSVLKRIPDKRKRIFFSAVTALCYAAYFALFLRSCYDNNIRLLPYYSWLFMT